MTTLHRPVTIAADDALVKNFTFSRDDLLCVDAARRHQQRPLITEDVDIIPPGTLRIEGGLDFMQGVKYPVSGITRRPDENWRYRGKHWNVTQC